MPAKTTLTGRTFWFVGLLMYFAAVAHRSTLNAAAPALLESHAIPTSAIGILAGLQVTVYVIAQTPMGTLVDRIGPKKILVGGAVILAVAQLLMAVRIDVITIFASRMLIGLGDAGTFIAAIRLISMYVAPASIPLYTQLTGIFGQAGQVVAAVPFVLIMSKEGLKAGFLSMAVFAVLTVVISSLVLPRSRRVTRRKTGRATKAVVPRTERRVVIFAFLSHMTTQFSPNAFALAWGFLFLTQGQGLNPLQAGSLMTIHIAGKIGIGIGYGFLTSRWPRMREKLLFITAVVILVSWVLVLSSPTKLGYLELAVFMIAIASGGPAALIAFDVARTGVEPSRLGRATGIVNVGGFSAALLTILLTGLILDGLGQAGVPVFDAFRIAMGVQLLPWLIGFVGMCLTYVRWSGDIRTRARAWDSGGTAGSPRPGSRKGRQT